MNRDELINLIPLYVADSLTEAERRALEKELEADPGLREEVRFWQFAKEAVHAHRSASPEEHPSAESVVGFALGLDPGNTSTLESHLATCKECQSDVRIIQDIRRTLDPSRTERKAPEEWIPERDSEKGRPVEWMRSRKILYAVPVVAAIILVLVLVRAPDIPPPIHEVHQTMTLSYRMTLRDPGQETEIPSLRLKPEATHIDLAIQIPKSGLPSVLYAATLRAPDGVQIVLSDSALARSGSGELDTLLIVSPRARLSPHKDAYQIVVTEILPAEFRDLTPEEYRYSFTVSDSSAHMR